MPLLIAWIWTIVGSELPISTGRDAPSLEAYSIPLLCALALALVSAFVLTPPAAAQTRSVTVRWTAPGDDSTYGKALAYDLRLSFFPIGDNNWANATPVVGVPPPRTAGSPESFTIVGLNNSSTYYVALKTIDDVGNQSRLSNIVTLTPVTTLDAPGDTLAVSLSLPFPNPAISTARVHFALAKAGEVRMEVFDMMGRRVRTLLNAFRPAGAGEAVWRLDDEVGRHVAAGIYFIRSHIPGRDDTRPLVVVR